MESRFSSIQPKPSDASSSSAADSDRADRNGDRVRRISLACTYCRKRKLRCDGLSPTCSRCIHGRIKCVYEQTDHRKKVAWQNTVDSLKDEKRHLETIVSQLKLASDSEAMSLLRKLRNGDETPSESQASDDTTESSPTSNSQDLNSPWGINSLSGTSEHIRPELRYTIPLCSRCTLSGEEGLPPEFFARSALTSFFRCGAVFFYVMSEEDALELVERVYHSPTEAEASDICELCAIAAIGCQYDSDDIPTKFRDQFFRNASLLLDEVIEKDDMQSMRVFICLSMFSIMEKKTKARVLIASGLKMARWNMVARARNSSPQDWMEWRRILRTLAFMECWLSSTLGYRFELTNEEISLLSGEANAKFPMSIANTLQSQMCKIALLSAKIYTDFNHSSISLKDALRKHTLELDRWHQELPKHLHLTALMPVNSEGISLGWRRAVLLVHMVYLGTHIQMHQHALATLIQNQASQQLDVNEFVKGCMTTDREYSVSAHQVARIVALLYQDGCVYRRCWLVINGAYTACVILLLGIAQELFSGPWSQGIQNALGYVKSSPARGRTENQEHCIRNAASDDSPSREA
ncbi:MAG: hypothetical protein M1834_007092 [Cirrosporium novae-zelandiae]|nr:MAG: hypothetical protein M1834_007092 [Cirrosporium novae-zelandiae]